ncbi:MAG: ATP-binding cassette domain-containing protein, partial [Gammaproteobacteria bacterium]|nr:ATP-binding cassette domain-containing protein [Gammaproteobacteria bacterium]
MAFAAEPGTTVVFGESGAGKSTLLQTILGALKPSDGRIVLGERPLVDTARSIDVPTSRRRVGIVFQDALLFPHLDVRENVAFGARGEGAT